MQNFKHLKQNLVDWLNIMDKKELIITVLQQRIGELTANYETQIAILRAEITLMTNEKEEKEKAMKEYSEGLLEKTKSKAEK